MFNELKGLEYHSQRKAYMYMNDGEKKYINDKSDMLPEDIVYLNLNQIKDELSKTFESNNEIKKLKMH